MMRSMYSGVSGLQAHQVKMDVIGNNIANVNTVGYKSQRVTFNEVFSQTLQSGTSASDETGRGGRNPMQVGLGVNVSSIDMLMTQGAAQRTDNPFDLMINGDGFIIVGDEKGKYYTRAGALRQDDQGNLVIPNGMKVQGWQPNDTGDKIIKGQVSDIKLNDPKNQSIKAAATTKIDIEGNLDSGETLVSSQIKMYDSLGNLYTANVYYQKQTDGTWLVGNKLDADTVSSDKIVLKDSKGNTYTSTADWPTDHKLVFDKNGKLETGGTIAFPAIDLSTITPTDDKGVAVPGVKADISAITIKFDLTQYASKSNVKVQLPLDGGGSAAGQMSGFDVGADGKITAYYSNGATKLLGQIVVAEFDNPAGLEKVGDNLFKTTANSGDFDSIGKEGNFQAGVLEMSNVDLSKEFTEMIVTQRGFQANSRIISVSDEMLQELVNIKR